MRWMPTWSASPSVRSGLPADLRALALGAGPPQHFDHARQLNPGLVHPASFLEIF